MRAFFGLILFGVFSSAAGAQNSDPYTTNKLSSLMSDRGLAHFYGTDAAGGAHQTPLLRFGATMKEHKNDLPDFISTVFSGAQENLLKAYKKEGREIVLPSNMPALDFVAMDFFKRQGKEPADFDGSVKINLHRTVEGDKDMENRLGEKLFKSLYGEHTSAESANPFITQVAEEAKKRIEALNIESMSTAMSSISGITEYTIYNTSEPIRLTSDKQIVVIDAQRQMRMYQSLEDVPAQVLAQAAEIHVSVNQFHALDAKLTGKPVPADNATWKEKLSSIYKSSSSGRIASSEHQPAQDILNLLDTTSCPVPV